jgi:hypothetical protein
MREDTRHKVTVIVFLLNDDSRFLDWLAKKQSYFLFIMGFLCRYLARFIVEFVPFNESKVKNPASIQGWVTGGSRKDLLALIMLFLSI